MSSRAFLSLLGLAFVLPAAAQDVPPPSVAPDTGQPAPFYLVAVEGQASLIRNGQSVEAMANTPLIEGDRLRTAGARVELRSDEGVAIFVDDSTVLDLAGSGSLRMAAGRVRVITRPASTGMAFRVESPNASVTPLGAGDFRVAVSVGLRGDETEVAAFDGSAEMSTERGQVRIDGGEQVTATGFGPPGPVVRATLRIDSFDRWVSDRLASQQPTASTEYLPPQLSTYSSVMDQYGTWEDDTEYGYVWYPSVPVNWRPYSVGYWGNVGYFGWVWIGRSPWAWPTHHYGRWGWNHNRWYWIPGAVWAPAWVSWGLGPGYVGWCPLGWNNAPVFALSVGNVSYYRGGQAFYGRWDGYAAGRAYDPHYGWTVVPAHRFRPGVAVWRHSVDWRSVPNDARAAFATQRVPPPRSRIATTTPPAAAASRRWMPPPTHYGIPRAGETGVGTASRGGLTIAAPRRELPAATSTSPYGGVRSYDTPRDRASSRFAVPRSPASSPYQIRPADPGQTPRPGGIYAQPRAEGSSPRWASPTAPRATVPPPAAIGRSAPAQRSAPPARGNPAAGAPAGGPPSRGAVVRSGPPSRR